MPILKTKGKFLLIASVLCLSILVSSMLWNTNLIQIATSSNHASDALTPRVASWGYIEVYVYDNESNPLVSAAVVCTNASGPVWSKTTNAAGFTNLTYLAPGIYNITANRVGFYGQLKPDLINWGGDDDYLSFYLKPLPSNSSFIIVNVTDSITKAPISGAAIHMQIYGSSTWNYLGITDVKGIYNITGLTKSTWYFVNASKAGYFTLQKPDYINWEGDDDLLLFALKAVAFNTQTLVLNVIVPNPDPSGDIHLQWNDLGGETGYTIYRGSSEGTLEVLATVGANVNTYYDVGVTLPTACYMIIASNGTVVLMSNMQSVVIQQGGGIPGFEILFVLLAIVLVFYISRSTKYNFKLF